jgi:hypothetical protein
VPAGRNCNEISLIYRQVTADCNLRGNRKQRRAIEKVPRFDWAGRGVAELMPPTFASQ